LATRHIQSLLSARNNGRLVTPVVLSVQSEHIDLNRTESLSALRARSSVRLGHCTRAGGRAHASTFQQTLKRITGA